MTTNLCVVDNTKIRRTSLQTVLSGIRDGNNLLCLYDAMESAYLAGSQTVVTDCNNDCATCPRKVTYLDLKDPLILFIHTSNKCFYRFVNDLLYSTRDCHVVCYSGGESSDDYNKLKERFPTKIRFFPCISPYATVDAINSKWDINGFVEGVIAGKTNPFDSLERKGTPHLIARSQILTPFVALHLAIQMEKKKIKVFNNMMEEEKEHCKKVYKDGLELLKDNGQKLKAKFMELLGLPANALENKDRIKPQCEKDLDKFIKEYKDELCAIFKGLLANNTFTLPNNIDNLIREIEGLSKIVEDGISCEEVIKKNRVFRHAIEGNAIPRLQLYSPPFSDKREGLRKELNDLKANLSSFDIDMISKYFNMDMKNEFNSSIRLIQEYAKDNNDDKISNMIKELISSLQRIVNLTLNVAQR